jgi:hypothetical protein
LRTPNGETVTSTSKSTIQIKFTDLNLNYKTNVDTTDTYYLVASTTTNTDKDFQVELVDLRVKGVTDGKEIATNLANPTIV